MSQKRPTLSSIITLTHINYYCERGHSVVVRLAVSYFIILFRYNSVVVIQECSLRCSLSFRFYTGLDATIIHEPAVSTQRSEKPHVLGHAGLREQRKCFSGTYVWMQFRKYKIPSPTCQIHAHELNVLETKPEDLRRARRLSRY